MNPADQPQPNPAQRVVNAPTLWLSLGLGSILIHLVLFILASLIATQTAKVQLDIAPIAVELVDPKAARSVASAGAIAVRPGSPSSTLPSGTQIQPDVPQPSSLNQPVEQPFVPLQPVKRKQLPAQPQPQQSNPFRNPVPQQPNSTNPLQTQPVPGISPSPGSLAGSASNPTPQPTGIQEPVKSRDKITQLPQGRSVSVVLSTNPQQTIFDPQQQPARPIESQGTVSINYPAAIAQLPDRRISMTVALLINADGQVVGVSSTNLSSPKITIEQADLDNIAEQIFETWKFEPARNVVGDTLLKPPMSNLTIDVQIQFP